ncbi:MAG: sensor histidine kinase [Planctomycetota bacterium]
MGEFFWKLFDTDDFPARWHCGNWSDFLGWLHILADLTIWLSYMGIPLGLGVIVLRRRDVPFPRVFWLFICFIASCGFTHLIEAGIFYWPVYRLSGLAKVVTAIISLATMVAMVSYVSRAVRLPSFRQALSDLEEQHKLRSQRIEELEQERARLQLAVEASGAGLWDWRLDPDEVTWDERTRELFGLSPDQRPETSAAFFERLHVDDRERVRDELAAAMDSADTQMMRFRIQRPDGSVRHTLSRCSLIRDEQGRATRMTGVVMDVSEQAESEALFQHAVESAPSGMMVVDESGHVRLANQNAADLFGYAHGELVGQHVDRFVPEPLRRRHADLRDEYFAASSVRQMAPSRDLTAVRRDGSEVPVEIRLNPVRFGGERGVIITVTDNTERRDAELRLRQYADQLEARNRALDEFTYLVSHDLKAPLRTISMVSEWLEQDLGDELPETSREHLATMRARTRKMHDMIGGALAYAREDRDEGTSEPVALAEALAEVRGLLDVADGVLQVPGDLPMVVYDRNHLVKILMNLIGNAIEHGGGDDARVRVEVEARADEYEVAVVDNGPGIDPHFHEQVFRMFKRAPGSTGDSTGVGLAIVRLLVERHGGVCRLASVPGEGCRFSFTIRRSERS